MTARRLPPNAGKGRKRGVPNKATKRMRLAFAVYFERSSERFNHLLDEIEKKDGARAAWDCLMKLVQFHVPRATTKRSPP